GRNPMAFPGIRQPVNDELLLRAGRMPRSQSLFPLCHLLSWILGKVSQKNMGQSKVGVSLGSVAPVLQSRLNVQCFHLSQALFKEGASLLRLGAHLHSALLLAI